MDQTSIRVGSNGLHAGNFVAVHGGGEFGDSLFTGQADVDASIDLLAGAGTPVYPVAPGRVRNADPACDIVVIAHDSGEWGEYLHLAVEAGLTPGQAVTTSTRIGTVLPATEATACGQHSGGIDHLHLAFALPSDSGPSVWSGMAGHVLCDQLIDADGNVGSWAKGTTFRVPVGCGTATTATAPTSTGSAATPVPVPAPTPSHAPSATAKPTSSPKPTAPPQPTGTTWKQTGSTVRGDPSLGSETMHFRATWEEPEGAATKFLIYGITRCLRASRRNDYGPCIVKGMALDMKDLVLLATVPGDKRAAKVDVERGMGAGPDPYWSYLIRAVNSAGKSKFTILDPGVVCWQCTY